MPFLRRILAACAATLPLLAWAQGPVVTTPQVRAELVAHAPEGVGPGLPMQLGLLIEHQSGWHTYWKNPGDSGLPTTLSWQLPEGASAGAIVWPTPSRLPVGPLMNYGYSDTVLLPVDLKVAAGFAAETLQVRLRADWLVCKEVCIPESGEFTLELPARTSTARHGAEFAAAARATPVALAAASARAEIGVDALTLRARGLPEAWRGQAVDFYPETAGVIDNGQPVQARWDGDAWVATVALDHQRSASPTHLPAVLARADGGAGVQLVFEVAGTWPAAAPAPAPLPPVLAVDTGRPAAPQGAPIGLALALVFAFIGGSLLNLMPCVFPVLSLKVLSFARHVDQRRALLTGGLAYTAGVVLSFVALAALLLALRAGGEQIGWGFQLQSPAVVASLAALFTVIGLNLAGVFEFGSVLPDRLATLQTRHPVVDSLLTGVLAVAVAAPCTAPFMGASLGYAVTLPTAPALAVFAALGLGMAAPYLLASTWPAAARLLPRPGAWMLTFRSLMAFPMFATVVWLIWVLGQQVGLDAASALLGGLVVLAFAVWALAGHGHSRRTRGVLGTVALLLLALTLAWVVPALRQGTPSVSATLADDWEPWSVARVAEASASGQPVFVDFTAAWCVTCQFNKRTTLADARVRDDFAARRVLLLRADWTRQDPAISAELARLGRSGVPVYALYAPGRAEPTLLSEILSVAEVRDALATLNP